MIHRFGDFRRLTVVHISIVALAVCVLMFPAKALSAQSLTELDSKVDRLRSEAQSIYRFDEDARRSIWEAYCGRLDPGSRENGERFAAEIGLQFQQRENDLVRRLLSDIPSMAETANRLQQNPDSRNKAGQLLESIRKEERILRELENGVVLKGSNHPFTQYAIEYGKKQHLEQCDRQGEQPKICDKTWPTLNGRPDLVFVDDSGLWIYEFKPDNGDARSMGETQVRGYVDGVQQYFQHFFQKGRTGGFTEAPDSDHGGKAIAEKLEKTPRAWSSDGLAIQAQTKVVSYPMCEKRF